MKVFLGFDPGGKGKFGWAVCIDRDNRLTVMDSGAADHAKGATECALKAIPKGMLVAGAGIDAPMFWVFDGSREADRRIRAEIGRLGAPSPGGTVQHFNSLRGACLIQGLLVLRLLRQFYPHLPVTEAHPKALLWLMGIARKDFGPEMVKLNDIKVVYAERAGIRSEDERDAVLGALTARAMICNEPGWEDLLKFERDLVLAEKPPISYWMPKISLSG
jgi:hypothetical protein